MPPILRPAIRRLHCKDPRIVTNFLRRYEKFVTQHQLIERVRDLEARSTFPLSEDMQLEYEELAALRCQGVRLAERKCRKLRMGQLCYSPELQQARLSIAVWSLLKERALGLRVSSRLLSRMMKKTKLHYSLKHVGEQLIDDHLEVAHKHYFSIKGSHKELRKTAFDKRAEALAAEGNIQKEQMLKSLRVRENQ